MKSNVLVFFVNGRKIEDDVIDPEWSLMKYLREKLRLPGTKMGCAEGGCGACTVMVSKMDQGTGKPRHYSVNACLAPIGSMHGLSVTTVEGIGSTKTRLHPVQERLAKSHGSQCGFCTPGFVMSMYTLLRNNPTPTMCQIEENLVGNLCRCTGYRPILEGFRTFSQEANPTNGCGKKDCCKLKGKSNEDQKPKIANDLESTSVLFDLSLFTPYDPTQEVIFPPELKLSPELHSQSLVFKGPSTTFFRPVSLQELLSLKQSYPDAKIVIGNTEVGVEMKFKNQSYPVIIHPADIPEMKKIKRSDSFVEVGASVTLTDIENAFKTFVNELPGYKTKVLSSVLEMLRWFAGRQIRNVAAIGGNIMTGSPISDLNPIFMACGAILTLKSVEGEREIKFDDKFYTSYRRNIAKPNEVLMSIRIPLTSEHECFVAYKQSKRRDDDIAIVNSAMKVSFEPQNLKVSSLTLSFGGMAPTTIMAKKTMEIVIGRVWDQKTLESATASLLDELRLNPSAPGGMVEYRRALAASMFFKFYLTACDKLHSISPELHSPLQPDEREVIKAYEDVSVKSTQFYQNVPDGQEKIDPVGRPLPHLAAQKQVSGEAIYTDDIPPFDNQLYAALVLSTHAHAKILAIDESAALAVDGVQAFFTAKDVPGLNIFGVSHMDDEFFASSVVGCVGKVIGILVAEDQVLAQKAAKLVKVTYEDLPDPIFTIQQAIEANSMWDPITAVDGDTEEGFKRSDFVLEGESYIGGQEHFYLEPNAHIAIPHDGHEIEIISSTQSLTEAQDQIARILGVPCHFVTCKVRRLGGGFGGKETRPVAISAPLALAAAKLRRPVRIAMDRDEDMLVTGGRHPILGKWKVGFNKDGKLVSLEIDLFANGGYCLDLSEGVVFRAIFSLENVYKIENVKASGRACRTNLPSNTAFRGFGTPQACYIMEDIIMKISEHLQMSDKTVRERNFYKSGDKTFYGQTLHDCHVKKCWDQVLESADYDQRKNQIQKFNSDNRFRKRGISLIPSKFGLAFGFLFLNQAGVLVHIYKDGSVLLSHAGVEMGQGIHTKMTQVASRLLKIPMESIYIADTSTAKVPNTTASAASSTADLNGMAIMQACEELLKRLAPYKETMPDKEWKDWVFAAYMDRVSLSSTGFYKTPDIEAPCPETRHGNLFNYFTFGATISEVEIDCLTGDHTVLRTSIVMDAGNPLNPALDIGQIEGAYLQGYGLFTMEQLVFSSSGALLTKGPGAYKIPSVRDIPHEFNVSLLRGSSNSRAIFSSKALGEPPLFSGASVFFAIREAVKAARCTNKEEIFTFNSPATAERIRMACKDTITGNTVEAPKGSFIPWALDI